MEQKNNRIQVLQETITKETSKQRAREKAFDRRFKHDWTSEIFQVIVNLVHSCCILSKDCPAHKRKVLEMVIKISKTENKKNKIKALMQWVLEWIQAVFSALSVQIKKIL